MSQGETAAPGGVYRPAAPERGAMLQWPRDFGTRFTIFVDTEEEFDWNAPFDRSAHSTGAVDGLPEAHRRFADQGVPLTYLIDYPIADDGHAVEIIARLLEDGRSAVGTQLHPWVNPPFEEVLNARNSFAGNLPPALEAAKIEALTTRIEQGFARRPRTYRAGRYGIGPATLGTLAGLGYRIDSSMRSRYDYSHQGGPDFRSISNHAFRAVPGRAIVELPLTTVFVGLLGGRGRRLQHRLAEVPLARGLLARSGLLETIALTPEDMPLTQALDAIRIAYDKGVRLLNFSFHSPSVVPGHTDYVRDAADLRDFYAWWTAVFALMHDLGIHPASEDELIAAIDAAT